MTETAATLLLLMVAMAQPAAKAEIAGHPKVIDGDTIEVSGQRNRLYGIDAPESGQICIAKSEWRCGEKAAAALTRIIGDRPVYCAERNRDPDRRIVAVCHLSKPNGPDMNAQVVREGWALAYRYDSSDYVNEEKKARAARRGVWRGSLLAPWDWRVAQQAEERADAARAAKSRSTMKSDGCEIKGNISLDSGERIYHVPGGQYYTATQINPSKGERWFCSEAEAQAAGWRRSKL